MFDFQQLDIYQKAKVFNKTIKDIVIEPARLDKTGRDQLRRASMSIVLNIAEGSSRFSKADRRNFFVIARGSVFECVAILDILSDEGIVTKAIYERLYELAEELSKMLFSMIRNLE